jgi:hypothetical protein
MTRTRVGGPEALRGHRLMRSWVVWTTGAEFIGFFVPATVAAVSVHARPYVAWPLMLLAGATEGFILGAAQARVLASVLPRLRWLRWAAATSGAATFAWSIGLLPASTEHLWRGWPLPVQLFLGGVGAVALLASIGVAQWWILRDHVHRAGRWIAITAAAWLAGLAAFMVVAPPLWHEGQSAQLVAAIGALAGLVMAGLVAVVTGIGLRTLLSGVDGATGKVARRRGS